MKSLTLSTIAGVIAVAGVLSAKEIGQAAPDFSAKNVKGEEVSLSGLKGAVVVLEWVNFDCPFVKKYYASGNLPKLQESYTGKDVIWLTISSAAEGRPAYMEPAKLAERAEKEGNKASHVLVDGTSVVGKAYDAKVTPHLYIINKEGVLVYNGAIDSKPTTDAADVETADKLFVNALEAVLAGKEVPNAKNQPYGCGVKY
jgi:hypothetical protein